MLFHQHGLRQDDKVVAAWKSEELPKSDVSANSDMDAYALVYLSLVCNPSFYIYIK